MMPARRKERERIVLENLKLNTVVLSFRSIFTVKTNKKNTEKGIVEEVYEGKGSILVKSMHCIFMSISINEEKWITWRPSLL